VTRFKDKFTLREMLPSDSESVNRLISSFEGDMITRFLVDTYAAIVSGTKYETIGVVVEATDHPGLIGMGTLRFGTVQFNGSVLPLAFLDGLKVHPDFRKQGLGYQIANWRVQRARERYGDNCVIGTGMAVENLASRAVASKWCREFIDPAFEIRIMPVSTRLPKTLDGITIREIETDEYEEFASRQNTFYKDYNLYEPGDAASIKSMLDIAVDGKNPYRFYAAVDANGNLLAGAQTWARGMLKSDALSNPPPPLHMLNWLFHLLPPDYTIRDLAVNGLWYLPAQKHAAHFLWESIRWLSRNRATTMIVGFDPRDPVKEIVNLKPWHQPRPKIRLAIHGPTPIDRNRLLFVAGRV
jgi:GNAT superfamily N-acetyltransferase